MPLYLLLFIIYNNKVFSRDLGVFLPLLIYNRPFTILLNIEVLPTSPSWTLKKHGLMYKLHKFGVKGRLWTLIDGCHVNTSYSVVSNQLYSDWFPVSQGVRQGEVLSTFLYLVFINDLLQELEEQSIHIGIYDITSSNPTLADDISLIALSPNVFKER